jgi:hypothetical protein
VPRSHQAACTQAEIDQFRTVCVGVTADAAACKSLMTASAACSECILPKNNTQPIGALYSVGAAIAVNVAGCVAIVQNTVANGAGCAIALQNEQQCGNAACNFCPDVSALGRCEISSYDDACLPEANAVNAACDHLGAAAPCVSGNDFYSAYDTVVPVFCLK